MLNLRASSSKCSTKISFKKQQLSRSLQPLHPITRYFRSYPLLRNFTGPAPISFTPRNMSRSSHLNNALLRATSNRVFNTQKRCFCDNGPKDSEKVASTVRVTFIDKDNNTFSVDGKVGENLLYLAHRCKIDMEGACEASLACTTCHCYVHFDYVSKLPEPSEQEEDLLDMAPFLQENSRLGCQIILTQDLDGLQVTLPKATRNFYVDGHKPKPH